MLPPELLLAVELELAPDLGVVDDDEDDDDDDDDDDDNEAGDERLMDGLQSPLAFLGQVLVVATLPLGRLLPIGELLLMLLWLFKWLLLLLDENDGDVVDEPIKDEQTSSLLLIEPGFEILAIVGVVVDEVFAGAVIVVDVDDDDAAAAAAAAANEDISAELSWLNRLSANWCCCRILLRNE